jgi:hypothetical protein
MSPRCSICQTVIICYTQKNTGSFGDDNMVSVVVKKLDVYKTREPRKSKYYRLVEAHHEELEGMWEERYQSKYGFWRPYVMDVIYRYLDCGDPHFGFARIKCEDCGKEYILPFSCKRRYFCPSCHQKRVIEFGEHLSDSVKPRNERLLNEINQLLEKRTSEERRMALDVIKIMFEHLDRK